jgi:hypothetical protein
MIVRQNEDDVPRLRAGDFLRDDFTRNRNDGAEDRRKEEDEGKE